MIAAPYYLLAGGILLVIISIFMAVISRASQPRRRPITTKMRDAEIIEHLRNESRIRLHSIVFVVGVLCIFASIVWRMARFLGP
jgi:hypothetical protein